ncbi:MAG: polysaccharide pyruvyl transferase family protein, partial [Cyanobacteria bacterium Co-bin13]|nr:polysaccharide pyruvyl transferase family protein [Cyanobacteria bacterium Co-bin13]
MKLFHYQRRDGVENFGDRLNLWLWPQLLPGCFDDDAATVFVGIGTLLNHRLPERLGSAQQAVVFTTGVGYERSLRTIPPAWAIYCVRGPLSARRLGLPDSLAITDGAILLRQHYRPSGQKRFAYAFMPHIHHATFAGEVWQQICQEIGFGYIDPRWSVEEVLAAIGATEVLLAEAMHGAIAAEALRVPWLPVQTSARILPFKWQDWCASIRVPFRPVVLPPVLPYPP